MKETQEKIKRAREAKEKAEKEKREKKLRQAAILDITASKLLIILGTADLGKENLCN